MAYNDYEPIIGLEIHAQLNTKSKLFCCCSSEFGKGDNENTCPVCTGMPGALPVINKIAIDYSIKVGLALGCRINKYSVFSRKNYFYPDLPKGYQISQYDLPICEHGSIDIFVNNQTKNIPIVRAHMEEDAGKSTHHGDFSLINLNRSSVPLLEIVSGPDLQSPEEAAEYARTMRQILRYLDVCDGNLEEGSLRCDCNISVRKRGIQTFGTKVEIKNINSFRFIEKALQFEIERQIDCLDNGETIIQETRLYDTVKNKTFSMRTKEDAQDYRYFPEPDLLPLELSEERIQAIANNLPELPAKKAQRFQNEYQIPYYDSHVLTQEKLLADFYEDVAKLSGHPKMASNWIMGEVLRELKESDLNVWQMPITANQISDLIILINNQTISGKIAKTVFSEMWKTGNNPKDIIKEKGFEQITDFSSIDKIITDVIINNPQQVAEYRQGKTKLFGFFVGQIMKQSKGQANPEIVNQLLASKLHVN